MTTVRNQALQKIQELGDFLEISCPHLEIDLEEEHILITDSQDRQYLLNYHGVVKQLWYSSALSGAHHFMLKDTEWFCTRTGNTLDRILQQELVLCEEKINE